MATVLPVQVPKKQGVDFGFYWFLAQTKRVYFAI